MSAYKALSLTSHVFFVLALCVHASVATDNRICACPPNPTKTIVVYIQDVVFTGSNTNYTDYPVAGIQGKAYGTNQFGTVNVFDSPVTIAASPNSTLIGRSRGFFAVAALGGGVIYTTFTIQFTGGKYAYSTLIIAGVGSVLINVPSQLGINGGTNMFKAAFGEVTFMTISSIGPDTMIKATINYRTAV